MLGGATCAQVRRDGRTPLPLKLLPSDDREQVTERRKHDSNAFGNFSKDDAPKTNLQTLRDLVDGAARRGAAGSFGEQQQRKATESREDQNKDEIIKALSSGEKSYVLKETTLGEKLLIASCRAKKQGRREGGKQARNRANKRTNERTDERGNRVKRKQRTPLLPLALPLPLLLLLLLLLVMIILIKINEKLIISRKRIRTLAGRQTGRQRGRQAGRRAGDRTIERTCCCC